MKNKVVVISVDAMITSDLSVLKGLSECKDFFSHVSQVNEMLSVFPALTYPCHVTMLTGCYPGKHGIFHNERFSPREKDPDWFWYSRDIKVPSIFTYAKKNGFSTASIAWPSTSSNLDVDYLISKIWTPTEEDEDKVNSPCVGHIYNKYKYLIDGHKTERLDEFSLKCTVDIIKEFHPDLVCTYYALIDSERHKKGYQTEFHEDSLKEVGRKISVIYNTVKDEGLLNKTTFVLLSDHGQLNTKAVFNLNVEFAKRGFISLENDGSVRNWRMYAHSSAFTAQIYTNNISLTEARDVLQSIADTYPEYLDRILNRFECDITYHVSGPFDFMVEGPKGVAFGKEVEGEVIQPIESDDYKTAKATHGHSPERGPKPPFLIAGRMANEGLVLAEARLVDVAPTILGLLGLDMPTADGHKLCSLIKGCER